MKKILFLSLLFATSFLYAVTPNVEINNSTNTKIVYGPYLQAVSQTSFTVVWTTNCNSVVWVEVAPDDGTHFYNKERPKYYETRFGRRLSGKLHTVTVDGLQPGTIYRYRILQQKVLVNEGRKKILYGEASGNDVVKHKTYQVTTLDPNKKNVNFSVVNDIHEHDSIFRTLYKNTKSGEYDFVCFNGDMTSEMTDQEYIFKNYLQSASELFAANIPLYMVRGNHEYRSNYAEHYMDLFPSLTGKTYYSFREGPVYFIVLDSGEDKPDSDIRNLDILFVDQYRQEEGEWLKKVVESEDFKSAPMKIVFCHMPPEPKGWHGCSEVSRIFVPTLNKAGIDLMLCGHIHHYRYDPIGKTNCNFPVVCNANLERMDVTADGKKIDIKMYDDKEKLTHSLSFSK